MQLQIDIFNNKIAIIELDVLTNYIDKFIEEVPYKINQKKETGLSAGLIRNLRLFKNTIIRYQKEALNDKNILIKNINLQFVEKYKTWLFGKGYSVNYVGEIWLSTGLIRYGAPILLTSLWPEVLCT